MSGALDDIDQLSIPWALFCPRSLQLRRANRALWRWTDAAPTPDLGELFPTLREPRYLRRMAERRAIHLPGEALDRRGERFPVVYHLLPCAEGERYTLEGADDRATIEKNHLLQSFTETLERNNRLLRRQQAELEGLLRPMPLAIFALNARLQVEAPTSPFCARLFGREIIHAEVMALLFWEWAPEQEERERLRATLEVVFGADALQWEMSQGELPTALRWRPAPEAPPRRLRLTWAPIWGADECLERLLLVVEDVTEEEALKARLEQERQRSRQRLQLLQAITEADRESLLHFLEDTAAAMARLRQAAAPLVWLRALHTLKGNARALRLTDLAQALHALEQRVQEGGEPRQWREALIALGAWMISLGSLAQSLFQRNDPFREAELTLARQQVAAALRQLEHGDPTGALPALDALEEIALTLEQAPLAEAAAATRAALAAPCDRAARLDQAEALAHALQRALTRLLCAPDADALALADAPLLTASLAERAVAIQRLDERPTLRALLADPADPLLEPLRAQDQGDDLAARWRRRWALALALRHDPRRAIGHLMTQIPRAALQDLDDALQQGDLALIQRRARALHALPLALARAPLEAILQELTPELGVEAELRWEAPPLLLPRDTLRRLQDALGHLTRNALVHGAEPPQERISAHKPPRCALTLRAQAREGGLWIALEDDGRGIDRECLQEKARAQGIAPPASLLALCALPGLSAASRVTTAAGRGVGVSAAQEIIAQLGGQLELASAPGAWTRAEIWLPAH